jgi:hypothetical protein
VTAADPPPDRLDRMLALVREHVPGLRLVQKADVPWMRLVGQVIEPLVTGFSTEFTTVIGDTVYLPVPVASFGRDELAGTLAHELVHQLDQAEHGLWFYASYAVAPVPVGRTWRAHWERRGYAVDLMLAWEDGGERGLVRAERRIRALFSGRAYGWMWAGDEAAAAYLAPVVAEVKDGSLQREFPYDRILAAWTGSD